MEEINVERIIKLLQDSNITGDSTVVTIKDMPAYASQKLAALATKAIIQTPNYCQFFNLMDDCEIQLQSKQTCSCKQISKDVILVIIITDAAELCVSVYLIENYASLVLRDSWDLEISDRNYKIYIFLKENIRASLIMKKDLIYLDSLELMYNGVRVASGYESIFVNVETSENLSDEVQVKYIGYDIMNSNPAILCIDSIKDDYNLIDDIEYEYLEENDETNIIDEPTNIETRKYSEYEIKLIQEDIRQTRIRSEWITKRLAYFIMNICITIIAMIESVTIKIENWETYFNVNGLDLLSTLMRALITVLFMTQTLLSFIGNVSRQYYYRYE